MPAFFYLHNLARNSPCNKSFCVFSFLSAVEYKKRFPWSRFGEMWLYTPLSLIMFMSLAGIRFVLLAPDAQLIQYFHK